MEHPCIIEKDWGWWSHFFLTRFRVMDPSIASYDQRLAQFCSHVLNMDSSFTVLDAGSGAGQVAAWLAQNGLNITAVEFSRQLIDWCENCHDPGYSKVRFVKQDLRTWDFDGAKFHAVLCLGVTFGYFSHQANLAMLKNLASALHKGGRLLIESDDPLSLEEGWCSESCEVGELFGSKAVLFMKRRFCMSSSSYEGFFHILLQDGRKVVLSERLNEGFDERIRVYSLSELKEMGETSGLTLESAWADSLLPLQNYDPGRSRRLVSIFVKD